MSALWLAYRMLAPCLGALAPAGRMFASPDERPLWAERLGRVPAPVAAPVDAWIHAASLGESVAVPPLLRELTARATGATFYLTATTRSGRMRLSGLRQPTSLAPLDAPQAIARFLAIVRPRRAFVLETELWPHWLLALRAARIPVAIVSARLSERSVHRYRSLGSPLRSLVSGLDAVLCQTTRDRDRWLAIGAPPARSAVVGNLKSDALPGPVESRAAARTALGFQPERPLLVLGSLRPGEPAIAARAWLALPPSLRDEWQVAALPRHPRAGDELRAEAARAGATAVDGGTPTGGAWRWDPRLGVLADYYGAADVALVGGSLVPLGGHNPLEPAARGAAVVMGKHHASQAEGVERLLAHHAIRVVGSSDELAAAWLDTLASEAIREAMSRGARAAVDELQGAAARAVARLVEWNVWPPA
jgi:3-deoxy-D-manno-octulosonic-acid transferase